MALTAPYMHDGSLANLQAVVEFYVRGGSKNRHLDEDLRPLLLNASDQQADEGLDPRTLPYDTENSGLRDRIYCLTMTRRASADRPSRLRSFVPCLVLLLFVAGTAARRSDDSKSIVGQAAPCCDSLARLDFLLGRWEGTQEGQPGSGTVTREYTRELNGRFIRAQNRSVYPAQPKNPKGEVHEDVGYFSLDRARKLIVFRQFHVESFVIQYVWDTASTASQVVMISEAIENIPKGHRARETYVQISPDELEEIFEIAEPGKDFQVYSRTRLKRIK